MHYPHAVLAAALTCLPCAALAQEFKKEADCVVGSKVADRKNQVGTVKSVKSSMCTVQLENGKEQSYLFWMLRKAGDRVETTDKLVNGVYQCYHSGGYAFIDIHIQGPDTYADKKGVKGRYKLDPASNKIVFESGTLTQANAKLLAGPKIGMNANGGSFYSLTCGLKKGKS
jgi:hypothetical protein